MQNRRPKLTHPEQAPKIAGHSQKRQRGQFLKIECIGKSNKKKALNSLSAAELIEQYANIISLLKNGL